MDRGVEILWPIRRDPVKYLEEKSIWSLQHFLKGYYTRIMAEGTHSKLNVIFRAFSSWLEERFDLRAQSHSVYEIVDSYAQGAEGAFDKFYVLFEEFHSNYQLGLDEAEAGAKPFSENRVRDICELLRLIRGRPELYIGYPHFGGVHAYLRGHEVAGNDLSIEKTSEDRLFDDFKQWIETNRLRQGIPRPWFKLIKFTCFYDCGTARGSAYSAFFEFLDEFAARTGRTGLFGGKA